jgi:hypothetical protein
MSWYDGSWCIRTLATPAKRTLQHARDVRVTLYNALKMLCKCYMNACISTHISQCYALLRLADVNPSNSNHPHHPCNQNEKMKSYDPFHPITMRLVMGVWRKQSVIWQHYSKLIAKLWQHCDNTMITLLWRYDNTMIAHWYHNYSYDARMAQAKCSCNPGYFGANCDVSCAMVDGEVCGGVGECMYV